MRPVRFWAVPLLAAFGLILGPSMAHSRTGAKPEELEFFEKRIRPVLVQHCYSCHSAKAKKLKAELRLDSRAAMLKGGESGPAIIPGKPEKSRLIEAINYKNVDMEMPPKGKLPNSVIADLTAWVKMHAPWPDDKDVTHPEIKHNQFDIQKRKSEHWAWRPINSARLPKIKDRAWPRTGADYFILAGLEGKDLEPAQPAGPRTWLRRIYFDLIGLPPTPRQIHEFLSDASPQAREKVVNRLLASPRFGERWGRHWLDLVRYAESRGHEQDYETPNAYQYRDYVIRALNADVPYDQFVTEHLAGDLLRRPRLHSQDRFNESILGTGFWFLGEEVHSPVDIRQDQADRFDNKIDVMTKTFLGLTVACARCHDHKFDAISTRDYYALYGFLSSSNYRLARFDSMQHNREIAQQLWKLRKESAGQIQKALAAVLKPAVSQLADYLLAASELLRDAGQTATVTVQLRDRLKTLAGKQKLDASRLGYWLAHLQAAAKDEGNPLHYWAKVALDLRRKDGKLPAELRSTTIAALTRQENQVRNALKNTHIILDYGKCPPRDWLPDDVTFGPGPVKTGDVVLANHPDIPIARFVEKAAAEKDLVWQGLTLAAGTQNDPGSLGGTIRSGRTLRTPSFTLTKGKVYYWVRGSGRVYTSIGSHIMVAGPLHGQLVLNFNTGANYQWVGHDLSSYRGQRAHLEFTSHDSGDFALAMIVQSDAPPGSLQTPNGHLLKLIISDSSKSVDSLAKGYQKLFAGLAERLAGRGHESADDARLANWVLGQPRLFGLDTRSAKSRLSEAASSFTVAQAKLLAQIHKDSRLALAMQDGSGVNEYVFVRGSPKVAGETVPRRFLEALAGRHPLSVKQGSGRLQLARQITDPKINPLLARVMVNRIWHHLFGLGLVPSVDNFGVLGEKPSHPELLDYLANQFVQGGWSVKKMIRLLVLSRTYQMASVAEPLGDKLDPGNQLLRRMRVRRLQGEAIRDAMLQVSGRLNSRMHGPSVPVYLTPFLVGRGRPNTGPLDGDGRRSLYLAIKRNFLSPMLMAFDTPIPFSTVGRRSISNVPAQALIMMNDPFVHQQAATWAKRVSAQSGSWRQKITQMYLGAFGRQPSESELLACHQYLKHQAGTKQTAPASLQAWTDLAHALFNVKEFIFLH